MDPHGERGRTVPARVGDAGIEEELVAEDDLDGVLLGELGSDPPRELVRAWAPDDVRVVDPNEDHRRSRPRSSNQVPALTRPARKPAIA